MKKDRLIDDFIEELSKRIPHRPELAREISRILKIEKEPASRRLSGNVSFSIDEMGILAKELDISIDSLLHKNENYLRTPIILDFPWSQNSIDSQINVIIQNLNIVNKISTMPYELGFIFFSIPIEILLHFPQLTKFHLFKWGHFFVGTKEFNDYSSWEVPRKFYEVQKLIENFDLNTGKRSYIWDASLVWILVKEIKYLHEMEVVNKEDKDSIKNELHSMLTNFEEYIKSLDDIRLQNIESSFYMSNIPISVNGLYMISEAGHVAFSNTRFSRTGFSTDLKSIKAIQEWMSSLIKISTLISKSGYKERRLFFREQHQIVDHYL